MDSYSQWGIKESRTGLSDFHSHPNFISSSSLWTICFQSVCFNAYLLIWLHWVLAVALKIPDLSYGSGNFQLQHWS